MEKRLVDFGAALRDARRDAGLTQGDLGQALGVTASAVGNWERGVDEPERSRVQQLERELHLAPGDLSRLLGYTPADSADGVDMNSRIARLPAAARKFIKDYIDAEERRMGE